MTRSLAAEQRRREAILDELAQHPDSFHYLALQARELAGEFPEGSRERLSLLLFDQAAREVATMLERAETARQSAEAS
jgi:hypothetical protein